MVGTIAQSQLTLRLALGFVFLIAAATKLRAPAAFVRGVLEYHVLPPPLGRIYGWLLPLVELSAALLLLSGFLLVVAEGAAVLMLSSFIVATVAVMIQGRSANCNCFGASQDRSRTGWLPLVRDLCLLAPAGWLMITTGTRHASPLQWPQDDAGLAAATLVLAGVLAAAFVLGDRGLAFLLGLADSGGAPGEQVLAGGSGAMGRTGGGMRRPWSPCVWWWPRGS